MNKQDVVSVNQPADKKVQMFSLLYMAILIVTGCILICAQCIFDMSNAVAAAGCAVPM